MATQMVVGDIMSCRAWCTSGNQAAVNTYNFQVISATGAGQTDQQLADAIDTFFASLYIPGLSPGATYNGAQVYFIKRTPPGLLVNPVFSTTSAGAGTSGTNSIPKAAAPLIKYQTNLRGPGGRGRLFIPFVSTIFVGPGGDPNAAWHTLVDGYCVNLLGGVSLGTPPDTAVLSFVLAKRPKLPATPTAQIIIACLAANKIGTLHKRGDFGRANASPI